MKTIIFTIIACVAGFFNVVAWTEAFGLAGVVPSMITSGMLGLGTSVLEEMWDERQERKNRNERSR